MTTTTAAKAPGMALTAAGYTGFQLFFTEFASDALSTTGVMFATDTTPFFMGAYATTDGPFLNPFTLLK